MPKVLTNEDLYQPTPEEREKLRAEAKRRGINVGRRDDRLMQQRAEEDRQRHAKKAA